ncbi:MAG: class I SAM-dependent methyltransferase [Myxococcota bacterium]
MAEGSRAAYHYAGESEWCRLSASDKAANVLRLCRDVDHASILDVGAGEGSVTARLAELGFGERHCAIELSQSGVDAIRGRGIESLEDCRVFDGERIPYADASFDLAVLSHVVEHALHPRKLLCEAGRVARHVFVEVPLEHHLRLPRDFVADDLGHINAYSPVTIRRLVQSCGFEVRSQITSHRSRATYTYHGDRLGEAKHAIKEWALRMAPRVATSLWTYHGALLCRPDAAGAADTG